MNSIRTRDGRGRRRLSFSKALPVYNTEEEMMRNEKLQQDQVINTNMADLIAQSRAYIAVPTDQKDGAKAKDDSNKNATNKSDAKDKEQHADSSKSESTTAPISPPQEEAKQNGSVQAAKEAAAPAPAKKPVVAPKQATFNPNCTVKFAYQPMKQITAAPHYIRYKPPVIATEHNFDWDQIHYEITEKDVQFLESSGLVGITHQHFEKIIDIFEKLAVSGKDQSLRTLQEKFYEHVDRSYQDAISKDTLQCIYMQYWKPERENRKVKSFLRCFWENPEYNDQDPFSAFRNLKKEEKIKTRFNLKKAEDRYNKCKMIKEQTYQVIDMLPKIWNREAVKKALDVAHDAEFDLRYDAMCKEKNIVNNQPVNKVDIKALQAPQNASESLKLYIKELPRIEQFKPPVSPHGKKTPVLPVQNQQQANSRNSKQQIRQGKQFEEQPVDQRSKKNKRGAPTARSQSDRETSAQLTAQNTANEMNEQSSTFANPEDNMSDSTQPLNTQQNQKEKPGKRANTKTKASKNVVQQQKKSLDVQNNQPSVQEAPVPEEKKDWTQCNLDMIGMFTRLLSEMKKSDIDISKQSFIQDKRYNLEELKQKATSIIQSVNQSSKDDSTQSSSPSSKNEDHDQIAKVSKNISSPSKKSSNKSSHKKQQRVLIRRGRNNMVYVRPILENVFDDQDNLSQSGDDSTNEDSAVEDTKAQNHSGNAQNSAPGKQKKQRSSGLFMRRLKKFMRKKKIFVADYKNGLSDGVNINSSKPQISGNGEANQQQDEEQPAVKVTGAILKDIHSSVHKQFLLNIVNDRAVRNSSLLYGSTDLALIKEDSVSAHEKEQILIESKSFGEKFKQFQNRNMLGSGKNRYNQQQQNSMNASQTPNGNPMKNTFIGNNQMQPNQGVASTAQTQFYRDDSVNVSGNTTIRFTTMPNGNNNQATKSQGI